jgi:hypothetical protein
MSSGEGDAVRAVWECLECNYRIPVHDVRDIDEGIAHAETHKEDDPAVEHEAPTL